MPSASAFLLLALLTAPDDAAAKGVISGVVVDAADGQPAAGAEVVLRVRLEGQFAVLQEAKADGRGQFAFRELPVGSQYVYLPGANRDGVHYPGPRIALSGARPAAVVRLEVRGAIRQPCPLVIRRHEVAIHPEPGAVRVTETLLIDNPGDACYVGRAVDGQSGPVTLRLGIPADFLRATFAEEFFGRRFSPADGHLVTGIPWPPGARELKFSYVLANPREAFRWERTMDLPCQRLKITVRTGHPGEVACSLPAAAVREDGGVTFEAAGRELPAGRVVRVELGRLPVPWIVYARWIAAAILAVAVAGTAAARVLSRRRARRPPPAGGSRGPQGHTPRSAAVCAVRSRART